eukprot:COSAG01_NODE_5945_length_3940_cov_3.383494_3_plen_103_part_00
MATRPCGGSSRVASAQSLAHTGVTAVPHPCHSSVGASALRARARGWLMIKSILATWAAMRMRLAAAGQHPITFSYSSLWIVGTESILWIFHTVERTCLSDPY